jgi:hypothetical protein
MAWDITDALSFFSFPSFPKFHKAVPMLQACSAFESIYDLASFCIYAYLWVCLSSLYEERHVSFVFLILANFT